jgi:hypothetical protein
LIFFSILISEFRLDQLVVHVRNLAHQITVNETVVVVVVVAALVVLPMLVAVEVAQDHPLIIKNTKTTFQRSRFSLLF